MIFLWVVGVTLVILILGYLFLALLKPEIFS